jgi:hypothetical protein
MRSSRNLTSSGGTVQPRSRRRRTPRQARQPSHPDDAAATPHRWAPARAPGDLARPPTPGPPRPAATDLDSNSDRRPQRRLHLEGDTQQGPPWNFESKWAGALADRLGGVEGLQDVGGGLGDAGAVVADLDQHPVAVPGGAHAQLAGALHAGRTRCSAVHLGWLVVDRGQRKALCHAGSAVRRI